MKPAIVSFMTVFRFFGWVSVDRRRQQEWLIEQVVAPPDPPAID